MTRKMLKDFTFSNGITVPAGTHVTVAVNASHLDDVSALICTLAARNVLTHTLSTSMMTLIYLKVSDLWK